MALDLDDDRKTQNQAIEADLVRWAAIVLAVVPVVLTIVIGGLTRNPLVALVVLLVVAGGLAAWAWTTVVGYGAGLVARPGCAPLTDDEAPRLHNLVDGLCVAHGLTKPAVIGVAGPGANIAAVTAGRGSSATTALVVSRPLLDSLSRIELEGVVAQQLGQLLDGSSALVTTAAALRSTPGLGSVLAGRLDRAVDPERQAWSDVAGARMTRYPPGLASALDTLAAGSTRIDVADATSAPLWLADPLGDAPTTGDEPSLAVRAAMLRER